MASNAVIRNDDSREERVADAAPAGWMAYGMACWVAWAQLSGYVSKEAQLLAGCIAMGCFIIYLGAAITQLKLGNVPGGCTWLYFGAFFAFGGGLCYFAQYFAGIYNWPLDHRILGFYWIVVAIVLIMTTPIFAYFLPLAGFISIVVSEVGLVMLALLNWGVGSVSIASLDGWTFFIAGLLGLWMAVGGIFEGAGMRFPIGKPWLKRKC